MKGDVRLTKFYVLYQEDVAGSSVIFGKQNRFVAITFKGQLRHLVTRAIL